jgi:hypothetical protein
MVLSAQADAYTAGTNETLNIGIPPAAPMSPSQSALRVAADALLVGQTAVFNDGTNGYVRSLFHGEAGDPEVVAFESIFEFGPKAVWDRFNSTLEFLGQSHPHNNTCRHVTYDEVTNQWSLRGAWGTTGSFTWSGTPKHAYHHNTLVERANGDIELWHRPYGATAAMIRWDRASNTWTDAPDPIQTTFPLSKSIFGGMEFFPERNSLVMSSGVRDGLHEYKFETAAWTRLEFPTTPPFDSEDNMIHLWSPINGGVIYLGGGGHGTGVGNGNLWVDSAGTVTQLTSCPFNFDADVVDGNRTNSAVCPSTGNLLLFTQPGGGSNPIEIWEYDPRRDPLSGMSPGSGDSPWQRWDGSDASYPDHETEYNARISSRSGPAGTHSFSGICTLWNHNCIWILQQGGSSSGTMRNYLYKHAELP